MPAKRKIVLLLTLLGSGLLLLGALLLPWWTGTLDPGHFEIDLRSMHMCVRDLGCGGKALSQVGEDAIGWSRVGISTFAASIVAAIALLLSGVQTLRRLDKGSAVHWVAGCLAFFTGLLSVLFVVLHPDFGEWTLSYGIAASLSGSIVGACAATLASGLHRA